MTSVLGISAFYHDSAAAIILDGKIIAAAQEERFTRKKNDSSYPKNAINYVLKEVGLKLSEIDHVVFYEKITKYPVLINTSFNVRGEPIVCSATNAFNCFMGTDLDILVCNNFILYKQQQNTDLLTDYQNRYEID